MAPPARPDAGSAAATSPQAGQLLAPMAIAGRLDRLRLGLADQGADALVVTSPTNIRYLTGFSGSAGILVVADGRATLVTDGRYGEQAGRQLDDAGVDVAVEVAPASRQAEAAGRGGARVCRPPRARGGPHQLGPPAGIRREVVPRP